jgi:hypothetical protein
MQLPLPQLGDHLHDDIFHSNTRALSQIDVVTIYALFLYVQFALGSQQKYTSHDIPKMDEWENLGRNLH